MDRTDHIAQQIEALVFASEQGITAEEIQAVLEAATEREHSLASISETLEALEAKYAADTQVLELKRINNAYQLLTKAAYYPVVGQLQQYRARKKLSQAAMETLAIIAYRQPITKLEIEQIRGVNCDYSVQRLLDRGLIQIAGKSSAIGHPILYATSDFFMDYFGMDTPADLPRLKDIVDEDNTIGQPAE